MAEILKTIKDQASRVTGMVARRPINAHSLEEFAVVLGREGVSVVEAHPYVFSAQAAIASPSIFNPGFVETGRSFATRYRATTPRGREVTYSEFHGYVRTDELDTKDAYDAAILRALVTAHRHLGQIRERVPDVRAVLVGPTGVIDEEHRAKLEELANGRKPNSNQESLAWYGDPSGIPADAFPYYSMPSLLQRHEDMKKAVSRLIAQGKEALAFRHSS